MLIGILFLGGNIRTAICAETFRLVRLDHSVGARFHDALHGGAARQVPIQIFIRFISRHCRGYSYSIILIQFVTKLIPIWDRLPLVPREEYLSPSFSTFSCFLRSQCS